MLGLTNNKFLCVQGGVRRAHNEVEMLCEQRSRRLEQSVQLYTLLRRADLLVEHLTEQVGRRRHDALYSRYRKNVII